MQNKQCVPINTNEKLDPVSAKKISIQLPRSTQSPVDTKPTTTSKTKRTHHDEIPMDEDSTHPIKLLKLGKDGRYY